MIVKIIKINKADIHTRFERVLMSLDPTKDTLYIRTPVIDYDWDYYYEEWFNGS